MGRGPCLDAFQRLAVDEANLEKPGSLKFSMALMAGQKSEGQMRRMSNLFQDLQKAKLVRVTDWQGHLRSGADWVDNRFQTCEETLEKGFADQIDTLPEEEENRIRQAISTGIPITSPKRVRSFRDIQCQHCGLDLTLGFDGTGFRVLSPPCPSPQGIDYTEVEINVPSGKLCVDDDLRDWYPLNDDRMDINTTFGKHQTTEAYAAIGLAHGFVGSSCPSVYRVGPGKFTIGNWPDEFWDEETEDYIENKEPSPWGSDKVAGVCTDLWWYSLADADDLQSRMDYYTPGITVAAWASDGFPGGWTHHVVDVRPGVYKLRHYHGVNQNRAVELFAELEWVREPDPVRNYLEEEAALSFTALECMIQNVLNSPTLHLPPLAGGSYEDRVAWKDCSPGEQVAALARVADHYLCTIGGGVEWHENGFPRTNVTPEAKDLAAKFAKDNGLDPDGTPNFSTSPEWRRAYAASLKKEFNHGKTDEDLDLERWGFHWYPISAGYGGLTLAAGLDTRGRTQEPLRLNRSFILLAQNVAQAMIQSPERPRLSNTAWPPTYEIEDLRKRMKLAARCLQKIWDLYPDIRFDPEFETWFRQQKKNFIDKMDLGPLHPPEDTWPPKPKILLVDSVATPFAEFDSAKSLASRFAGHPKDGGYNARKEVAKRYVLDYWEEGFWRSSNKHSVPLHFVARVVQTHATIQGPHLELAFEYGPPELTDVRWAISADELPATRFFSDLEEYDKLKAEFKEELDRNGF